MTNFPRSNWANSYHYGFRDCLFPTSVDHLQSLVATSPRVKVLGSRHSFNPIVDGEVAMLLSGIGLDPAIGDGGKSVSIGAHATYGDLANFLNPQRLAVHNLASLPHISIAGAIATATHGSGSGNGNLATSVRALEFVAADGSLVSIKRGDADFDGMVVHLGALGVLTRVTLDVEPAFEIAQTIYEGLGWDGLYANLDTILNTGYSVSIFTNWGDRGSQVWVKSKGGAEALPHDLHGARLAAVKRHPIPEIDPVHCTDQLGVPGLWSDRLPHFKMGFTPSNGDEIQSEFHVPRRHGAAAIRALAAICDRFLPVLQVTEFRAVAADRLWLSPQYQRDTLSMHFTWIADTDSVNAAVAHMEEALAPFDVLPHWGKVFSPAVIGARYPMLADFRALRDRMDPERKFSNPWLEQVVFG